MNEINNRCVCCGEIIPEGRQVCPICENKVIEEMAKVIKTTEQIARDAHCGLPSPTMYAKDLCWKGYRKQSELTPCDVCKFNPPSSGDGKPCAMCPAQAKGEEDEG